MHRILHFLRNSAPQFLATIGQDGKPKVRPFKLQLEDEGKLYFCSSNKKMVYKELINHPWVELCACGEGTSWIRLSGRAIFVDDPTIRAMVFGVSPLVQNIYKSSENPIFEVFYLEDMEATIADLTGNPLQKITLH